MTTEQRAILAIQDRLALLIDMIISIAKVDPELAQAIKPHAEKFVKLPPI